MDTQMIIELLDVELSELNDNQKKYLRDRYNLLGCRFEYGIDDYGLYIIKCSEETFRRMEYYLGLEYVRDEIDTIIKQNGQVLVAYNENDRVSELFEKLKELA
jgi:hypothetical protein